MCCTDVFYYVSPSRKAAHPAIVFFNSSSYYKSPEDAKYEEELGPEINHTYGMMNSKDFSFPAADLIIHWPLTIAGKHWYNMSLLLYFIMGALSLKHSVRYLIFCTVY